MHNTLEKSVPFDTARLHPNYKRYQLQTSQFYSLHSWVRVHTPMDVAGPGYMHHPVATSNEIASSRSAALDDDYTMGIALVLRF